MDLRGQQQAANSTHARSERMVEERWGKTRAVMATTLILVDDPKLYQDESHRGWKGHGLLQMPLKLRGA